jgi:mannosyltransferase
MRNANADWSRADLLVVPILLFAAGLRLATAGYSLWFDEIAAVTLAHQPLELLWSGWMARETNPPLYYTLLKGWMAMFGESDLAVQALSTLIGTAGIGAAWWLARRIGGVRAGLLAALLFALSAAHVDFSQEVRGYILAHTAALFGCIAMVAWLERPRFGPLAGYAFATLVALYSHTTMVVFVALANVAMLWLLRRDRAALARWLAANLGVALLWSWWAWISLAQAKTGSGFSWIARPDLGDGLGMTAVIYLPLYLAVEKIVAAPLLASAWLAGMVWFAARDRRPAVVLLTTIAVGAPILLWALSQALPVFLPRTLFWAAGPVLVLVAVALTSPGSRGIHLTLLALFLALQIGALWRWLPERETEGWRLAVVAMARADPDGIVLVQGDAMAVAAHHYIAASRSRLRLVVLPPPRSGLDPWADGLTKAPHLDAAAARTLLARRGRVFTLNRGDYDPGSVLTAVGMEKPLPQATNNLQPRLSLWRARPSSAP